MDAGWNKNRLEEQIRLRINLMEDSILTGKCLMMSELSLESHGNAITWGAIGQPVIKNIYRSSLTGNVYPAPPDDDDEEMPSLLSDPPIKEKAPEIKEKAPEVKEKAPELVAPHKPPPVESPVEFNMYAKELVKEEEKEIKKKLKKKEKKKRQKAKKKELESKPSIEQDSSEESDDEDKDQNSEDYIANSAFAAGCKKGGKLTPSLADVKAQPTLAVQNVYPKPVEKEETNGIGRDQDSVNKYVERHDHEESIRKAKEGAVWTKKAVAFEEEGKPIAARTMYSEALISFNKSIKLWPYDCRYYANRSYVYTQLGEFESAVRDADFSVGLDPDFVKGYFRKGRALLGLKKYDEADGCFLKILELEPDCEEAKDEIAGVKFLRLKDMGFKDNDINVALEKFHDIFEDALQYLINKPEITQPARVPSPVKPPTPTPIKAPAPKPVVPVVEPPQAVKVVEVIPTANSKLIVNPNIPVNPHEDPRNPLQSKSIWVGNLNDVTDKCEKKLRTKFAQYGNILNVTIKPESRCAFVNYADPKSAGEAMKAMQGQKFGANTLIIRYPANNNAATTQNKPNLVLAKGSVVIGNKTAAARPVVENKNPERQGTVECRNWRLGHCTYGPNCWYKHVPEHNGIDKA